MKRKKYIILLMSMIYCVTTIASDFNAVCPSGQTLYYNIVSNTDHTVEVTFPGTNSGHWTGYTQPTGDLIIPSTVNHGGVSYTVIQIGASTFHGCNISSVTIPNTIVSIGHESFYNCSLTSIIIPASVEILGRESFRNNPITNITISNPNIKMDRWVFHNTTWYDNKPDGLVSIGTIIYSYKGTMPQNYVLNPTSVTSIAGSAFSSQPNLTSIALPNTLKTIGVYAFYGCGGFSSITIPSSVENIGDRVFENCGGLITVNYNAINASVFDYYSSYTSGVFRGCDNLTNVYFGNEVVKIPEYAFCCCTTLTGTLSYPESLNTLGVFAFFGCTGLTSISLPNNVLLIGDYAFGYCDNLQTIHYNAVNCETASFPFTGCNNVSTIIIGSNVQNIPPHLFYGLTSISGTLIIPDSVTTIGDSAFNGCTGITSVIIGSGVNYIGNGAFSSMTGLTTITYNAINCASSYILFSGSNIQNFNIGSNVQTLPDNFLYNCINLTSVTFPNSLQKIGSMCFYNCGLMGTVILPASITNLGYYAFSSCNYIIDIQCYAENPPIIESINGYAWTFYGCWDKPLYVPCESISAYQSALGWSNFTNITCIDDLVEENLLKDVVVYSNNKEIIVKGINGQSISVYGIDGRRIKNMDVSSDEATINVPDAGVYIVKIGANTTRKIVVQ